MTARLETWHQELQQLRTMSRQLSETMSRSAVELRERGWEPSESLLQQMQQFRADFRRLRECLQEGRTGSAARIVSLQDIEEELSRREQVAKALERVNRAAALRPRTGEATGPLFERLHGEISATRSALTAATPSSELLSLLQTGRHPLVVAVRLAEGADDLNDDDWGTAIDTVTSTLGRDLATALARGRLILGEEPVETQSIH